MLWAITIPLLLLLGLGLAALMGMAYGSGYAEGMKDGTEDLAEAIDKSWQIGWNACEISRETADVLGTNAHVREQRRNAGAQ